MQQRSGFELVLWTTGTTSDFGVVVMVYINRFAVTDRFVLSLRISHLPDQMKLARQLHINVGILLGC